MQILKFENEDIEIIEDSKFDFLLTTKEVAKGYGMSVENIRSQKSNHKDELIEGKHFLSNFPIFNGKQTRKITVWTKRGVIRLGFFIKSERAKKFRDWSEDLILDKMDITEPKISLKQRTEDLAFAFEQYEIFEKAFKKFGNISPKELAGKTSNFVFQETGIDFLKMYGGFQKEIETPKHSFQNSFSLTSLLEKHNIQIITSKFNLKLEKLGIIERYGKSWKILDLEFGINETYQNDNNPRYFEETFEKLLNLVYLPKESFEMPRIF